MNEISARSYPCAAWPPLTLVGLFVSGTYIEYADIYPEAKFVFCGDNGQADHFAAELMAMPHIFQDATNMISQEAYGFRDAQTYRDQYLASFIHVVQPLKYTLTHDQVKLDSHPDQWQRDWERCKIFFHQSYVEAARKLPSILAIFF